ncbi:competence protein ComK [Jeotgalicoccus huakuii]|nr:competence protein ComK [Jeotgalicoccus huakuii]
MTRQHYTINDNTMYVVAKEDGRYVESTICELYGDPIKCLRSPNKVIEYNCKLHSQSYSARKELSRSLTEIRSKHPIIIDLFASYIYFCTHSDRVQSNSWFNLKYIQNYYPYRGQTLVKFENNEELVVDISYASYNKQYLNAVKLYYKFNLEKEKYYKKNQKRDASLYRHQSKEEDDMLYINEAAKATYIKLMRSIDEINTIN